MASEYEGAWPTFLRGDYWLGLSQDTWLNLTTEAIGIAIGALIIATTVEWYRAQTHNKNWNAARRTNSRYILDVLEASCANFEKLSGVLSDKLRQGENETRIPDQGYDLLSIYRKRHLGKHDDKKRVLFNLKNTLESQEQTDRYWIDYLWNLSNRTLTVFPANQLDLSEKLISRSSRIFHSTSRFVSADIQLQIFMLEDTDREIDVEPIINYLKEIHAALVYAENSFEIIQPLVAKEIRKNLRNIWPNSIDSKKYCYRVSNVILNCRSNIVDSKTIIQNMISVGQPKEEDSLLFNTFRTSIGKNWT